MRPSCPVVGLCWGHYIEASAEATMNEASAEATMLRPHCRPQPPKTGPPASTVHQYGLLSSTTPHDKSQASIFCFFVWRYVICWCDKSVTVCDRMCHILTEKPSVHSKQVVKRSGGRAQMCIGVRISWRIRVSSCFPVFVRLFAANKQTSTGYHHWVGNSDSRI